MSKKNENFQWSAALVALTLVVLPAASKSHAMNWQGNRLSTNVIDLRPEATQILTYISDPDLGTLDYLDLSVPPPDGQAAANAANIAINFPPDLGTPTLFEPNFDWGEIEIDIPGDWWPIDGIPFGG